MKKIKRVYIIVPMSVLLILSIIFVVNKKINANILNNDKTEVLIDAKTIGYNNLSEMEIDADLIILGEKIAEADPNIIKNDIGDNIYGYTVSDFKITEIFKNSDTIDVKANDIISILENQAYDKDINTEYHIAGYKKMELESGYLLFLSYSEKSNWYIPLGITFGKVPLNENEVNFFRMSTNEQDNMSVQNTIIQDARKKYINN